MRAFGLVLAMASVLLAAAPSAEAAGKGYRLLRLDRALVKWGQPDLGFGATVSYALVDGPMRIPGARNCRALAPIDRLLDRSGLARAAFEAELRSAFAVWSAVADIRFVAANASADADILIGAQAVPRGIAFADITGIPAVSEGRAVQTIDQARICLNPEHPWKIGFGGDPEIYDLRYALAHEIGHAIGLDHPGRSGQLMGFSYSESFRQPQPGDVAGAVALYGPGAPSVVERDPPAIAVAPTNALH